MMRKIATVTLAALAVSAESSAQAVAGRVATRADRELVTLLVALEDSRDSTLLPVDPRRRGLASPNPFIRAFTVRGLGRIERASLIPAISPAIDDPIGEVRSAATDALAQAASKAGAAEARAILIRRFRVEREPAVRAALLEAIGRLSQGSADQVKATAMLIAPSLAATSPVERRGAIRGIFFLSRKQEARAAGVIPPDVTDRVYGMVTDRTARGYSPADRVNLATILFNAMAMSDSRMLALSVHSDPYVRDRAVAALGRATDTATVRSVVGRALTDVVPIVRFRAVGIYARRLRSTDGCAPLLQQARDANVTVAIAAIDALAGCRTDSVAVTRFLDSLASTFKGDASWHLPTHAVMSLAALDPGRARGQLPKFEKADDFFVRMYADSVARLLRDTAALYRLAKDPHPNVQSSALAGLSALVGHAADSIYIAALKSEDNQVLMAASSGLKGSTSPGALAGVVEGLNRLRNAQPRRETVKDGFDALQARFIELGGRVADLMVMSFPKTPTPTFAQLAALEEVVATIEMADGAVIRIRLHPFDAPTNAARFVRLARARKFDGLTFHRVAPFFVVQGPSPNANEYSAPDAPFTRDELGRENLRGTVGLSTRGRDTGDGQIYINTVDNSWLDHEYTVMGTVVSGLDAFDRMQEGARIKRIVVGSGAGLSNR